MFFEISAEETRIRKMIFPCYLLNALAAPLELHLELEDDILIDDGLGRVPRHLPHDIGEILGGDVHEVGIIVDIT